MNASRIFTFEFVQRVRRKLMHTMTKSGPVGGWRTTKSRTRINQLLYYLLLRGWKMEFGFGFAQRRNTIQFALFAHGDIIIAR